MITGWVFFTDLTYTRIMAPNLLDAACRAAAIMPVAWIERAEPWTDGSDYGRDPAGRLIVVTPLQH